MVTAKDVMKVQRKTGRRIADWYSTWNDGGSPDVSDEGI
jgi:hypothetical protein